MHDEIGNIALNEHLTWCQTDDLIGGHATIRASDPQVLGALLPGERVKETRLLSFGTGCPCAIVDEKVVEIGHGTMLGTPGA